MQIFQRLTATTRLVEPGPLSSARREHKVQPERHILEDTVPRPEHNTSALLEHRLPHKPERTPQVHNTMEPSGHKREHRPLERRSSVWRCSTWRPERHTTASSSTD